MPSVRRPLGRSAALGLVAAAAAAAALLASGAGVTDPAERASVDARFRLRGAERPPSSVAVVGIDDVTFGDLKEQFPFPRKLHAALIRRLHAAHVLGIAYDVQFTEPTDQGPNDNALIRAVTAARPVVLSTTEVDARTGATGVLGGGAALRASGAAVGNTAVDLDDDGVLRRLRRRVDGLASFPVVAAETFGGRRLPRSAFGGDDSALIDYPGPPGTIATYSFSRVLSGQVPASRLRGRVVVVGATAPSLGDVHPVPTGSGRANSMPGPEIEAAAIATLLEGVPLRRAPGVVGVLLTLLLACAVPALALRLTVLRTVAAAVGVAAIAAIGAYLAFRQGRVVPVAEPGLALLLGTLGALATSGVYAALERERTRTVFSRFVAASVVDDVLARSSGDDVRLGGVSVDATVLFCDLRGSTALLELAPETGIDVLNRFLSEMADAVLAHGGTLVGFRGDGLMALFGAPLEQPDHAARALAAAREMAGTRLTAINAWLPGLGGGLEPLRMGVGLDSGVVMAGTVGSQSRMEYTAIGDAANVAARVEGLTRTAGHAVLLTAATRDRLPAELAAGLLEVGERDVRGRHGPVLVFAGTFADRAKPA